MDTSEQPRRPRRLWREPLLHFLLAGAALFAIYRWVQPASPGRATPDHIVVTADDLRQMSVSWLAQGRPPPTPDQMQRLVGSWVREEVLFREALALGLDKDDTIVKRRMVQKMEFLAEDISDLREPERTELQQWFQRHADRFAEPPRATFRHLYFSPDRRGGDAGKAAERALVGLAGKAADAPATKELADPFMLQDYYGDRSFDQIAKEFGPRFASALFELEPGSWAGPIESGFGWHLIFVDSITPRRVPSFEEVEPTVRNAWNDQQREEFKRNAFEQMRSRYVVELPAELTPAVAAPASAGSAD
jgi:hypothetical protein